MLLFGDIVFLLVALWLTLLVRHGRPPAFELFREHLVPFGILFLVWVLVFYIAGLYEKHTTILKSRLPSILVSAQLANAGLAVVFFYFIPFFGITPKTVLFIYLFISSLLILFWRAYLYLVISKGRPLNAVIIGSGSEMKELLQEVNNNPIYNMRFISSIDLDRADTEVIWDEVVDRIYAEDVSVVAIDLSNEKVEPVLPHLYNLIFSKVSFIDMNKIYEDIFDRVPLSLLKYNWFLENISTEPRGVYDTLKRVMDICLSFVLLILSLPVLIITALAVKLGDGGSVFITQERVGQGGKVIRIHKFRSMEKNDLSLGSASHSENKVTKVGALLRKTRIDELPQLWSVLKGSLSLIGPRPELPAGVANYVEKIPYYNVRHLIKPGLSGWAQIYHEAHPHHSLDARETKNKLSYDLYYIKNRSFLLDIKIALRTLKILASIAGR